MQERPAARPFPFLRVLWLVLALAAPLPTLGAEDSPRLPLPAAAPLPAEGRYLAEDRLRFMVVHNDDQIRLRFIGNDEVFYLTSEPAPLGGRVLKYDTGEVVLQVAGWGGVTLYTADEKSGVPAELADDDTDDFDPKPVAAKDLKSFAAKLAQGLVTNGDFAVGFTANWDDLMGADGQDARPLAVDSMRNAAYALSQIAKGPKRAAVAQRFHLVRVVESAQPGLKLQEGTLVISFAPSIGLGSRPSSLAIARVLEMGF